MINTIVGSCNNAEIIFKENEGRWEATVPYCTTGEYIVELTAWDENGNSSYFATMLFAINTEDLSIEVSLLDIGSNITVEQVQTVLKNKEYNFDIN